MKRYTWWKLGTIKWVETNSFKQIIEQTSEFGGYLLTFVASVERTLSKQIGFSIYGFIFEGISIAFNCTIFQCIL